MSFKDVRHSASAPHETLAEARLAVQSFEIRERSDPSAGDHPRAHEEGDRAQEAGFQERQTQRHRHLRTKQRPGHQGSQRPNESYYLLGAI